MMKIWFTFLSKQSCVETSNSLPCFFPAILSLHSLEFIFGENVGWKKPTANLSLLMQTRLMYFICSRTVVSNQILCVATFVRIWEIYSLFIIRNPILSKGLSPHSNLLLPHVANGDKVGQHCCNNLVWNVIVAKLLSCQGCSLVQDCLISGTS